MKSRPYLQLDVFADRPGAGNPLGVVFDADALDAATMQTIAAWTNLSETIFLLPPTAAGADYRVRIFTPRQELPFAGHPSVGAAWAAVDRGWVAANKSALVQECAAGLLPVRVESRAGMRVVRRPSSRHPRSADRCFHAGPGCRQPVERGNRLLPVRLPLFRTNVDHRDRSKQTWPPRSRDHRHARTHRMPDEMRPVQLENTQQFH